MKLSLAVAFSILFFAAAVFAQTPAQIDVTSLTIDKGTNPVSTMTISATGLPAPYQSPLSGQGSGMLSFLEVNTANPIGATFRTNWNSDGGNNFFTGFGLGGSSSDRQVRFRLTGTSPDVVLYPTILRKRQKVTITVPAIVKGKIEIFDRNTLIAVDENVHLEGTLKVNYVQYLLNTTNGQRRAFDFRNFTLSYTK